MLENKAEFECRKTKKMCVLYKSKQTLLTNE